MDRPSIRQKGGSGYGFPRYIPFLLATLLLGMTLAQNAVARTRIVVVPLYTEEGRDAGDGGSQTLHYRRTMGFIENQLVRHGFEVINPFARDASEAEFNRIMETSREDSVLACENMCKKYAVDAAYIIWLTVKRQRTPDGYCKAKALLDGQGYDSAGRSLGANVSKTFKITRRDCDDAVSEVEKEIGDLVGRKLTAWNGESRESGIAVTGEGAPGHVSEGEKNDDGVLQRRTDEFENVLEIRLSGSTQYELNEIFGKVINTATGVTEAERYSSSLIPDNPQACFAVWRVRIEETDPFRLQANVMRMIDQILDAGGELTLRGVPYRYTPAEVDLLKGIRPAEATTREVRFVVDRERARDREFSGRHDPHKAR